MDERLIMRLAGMALGSPTGQYLADLAVRKLGGGAFLGPVVRIMVDSWGADYLDVDWVLHHLDAATPAAWARAWERRARHYEATARELEARDARGGARALYAKASLYYQAGAYALSDESPLSVRMSRSSVRMFRDYGRLCDPPIEWLEIPYRDGVVHAYLRLPVHAALPASVASHPSVEGGRAPENGHVDGRPGAHPGVDRRRWPIILVVPGLGSTKEQPDYRVDLLLERGFAVCAMDFPGHGQSRDRLRLELDSYRAVLAVLNALAGRDGVDAARVGLLGTSLGGAVVLRAAAEDRRPRAVASIAGFYEPRHWYRGAERYVGAALKHAARDGAGEYTRSLVENITLRGHLRSLSMPVLLVHGDSDAIIPVDECRAIAGEIGGRAEVRIVGGGDHGATNVPEVRHVIADWLVARVADPSAREGGDHAVVDVMIARSGPGGA